MTLEDMVTHGRVACIKNISYGARGEHLLIEFESCSPAYDNSTTLIFEDIEDCSDVWHSHEDQEQGEQGNDSLIGLTEYPEFSGVRYVILTVCREIVLFTKRAPILLTKTHEA
jgi:hypothetical protein